MMEACSSIMLFSPIMTGPASAMIVAFGCITVMLPTVIVPRSLLSTHTTAPGAIVMLIPQGNLKKTFVPYNIN